MCILSKQMLQQKFYSPAPVFLLWFLNYKPHYFKALGSPAYPRSICTLGIWLLHHSSDQLRFSQTRHYCRFRPDDSLRGVEEVALSIAEYLLAFMTFINWVHLLLLCQGKRFADTANVPSNGKDGRGWPKPPLVKTTVPKGPKECFVLLSFNLRYRQLCYNKSWNHKLFELLVETVNHTQPQPKIILICLSISLSYKFERRVED